MVTDVYVEIWQLSFVSKTYIQTHHVTQRGFDAQESHIKELISRCVTSSHLDGTSILDAQFLILHVVL